MHWSFTQSDLDAINEKWYQEKIREALGTNPTLRNFISAHYKAGYNSRQIRDALTRRPA